MKKSKVITILALLFIAIGTASASFLDSVTIFGGVSALTNLESEENSFDFSNLKPDMEFGLMVKVPNDPGFPLEVFQYTSGTFSMSAENKWDTAKANTILGLLVKIYNTNLMRIGIGIGGAARAYDYTYSTLNDGNYRKYSYANLGFGALLDFQVNLDSAWAVNFDLHGSYYLKNYFRISDRVDDTLYQEFQDIKYLKVGASIGLSLLFR